MIRTDSEYKEAVNRFKTDTEIIETQRIQLIDEGYNVEEVERGLQPLITFHLQLAEEITWYENVSRGRLTPIHRLTDLGRVLIALRISRGLTQKQLAERLEVAESSVSRDERNEYHGITIERAQRVLDVLDAEFVLSVEEQYGSENSVKRRPRKNKPELTVA
jgi:DNA-directed RNA polymerase specialized sigma subunit